MRDRLTEFAAGRLGAALRDRSRNRAIVAAIALGMVGGSAFNGPGFAAARDIAQAVRLSPALR